MTDILELNEDAFKLKSNIGVEFIITPHNEILTLSIKYNFQKNYKYKTLRSHDYFDLNVYIQNVITKV